MRPTLAVLTLLALSTPVYAQEAAPGPAIHSFGAVFDVADPDFATRTDMEHKVAFEIAQASNSPDRVNASLNSVARFINMHAAAGVPRENIRPAVVVHGPAGWELLDNAAYRERHGVDNPNAELIRELTAFGVKVILCGQTAASRGIPRAGLVGGVEVALSAMTAFMVLQEDGYRVNPW
jgi:intracellular sulfur oxidation DsrE/DsrF family protein